MALRGDAERYGSLARWFHWLAVLFLIALVAGGNFVVNLEYTDPFRHTVVKVHRTIGLLMFTLILLRFAWMFFDRRPPALASLKRWEYLLSKFVQGGFYVLLLAIPVFGFLFSGSNSQDVQFAGFAIPSLSSFSRDNADILIGFHKWLTRLVVFFAILHIAGVLKHHFIDKIPIWKRMI